jgi:hypothetical protein
MSTFENNLADLALDIAQVQMLYPYDCPYPVGADNRYVLEELIAIGPRSWVYRALDNKLSSADVRVPAIVKISRVSDASESLHALQVRHPDVPVILDRGVTDQGHPFIVMEQLFGQSLNQEPAPWPRERAIRFIERLGRVLAAAHAQSVVHCDLKPENIFIGPDDRAVLLDFDLAGRTSDNSGGMRRGNLAFMSPEQYRGEPDAISPQADIYGLGGLLVYLVTGTSPHGETEEAAATFLKSGQSWQGGAAGDDLTPVLRRACAASRAERYLSIAEFCSDLAAVREQRPVEWLRPSPWHRTRLWARRSPVTALLTGLAATAVVASVIGTFVWQELQARREIAEAKRVAQQVQAELDRVNLEARTQLESFARYQLMKPASGQGELFMPMLVWMSWLSEPSMIGKSGVPPLINERVDALARIEQRGVAGGRELGVPVLVARLTRAQLLLQADRAAESLSVLQGIRGDWAGRLHESDPLLSIIKVIERVAQCKLGTPFAPGEYERLRDELIQADAPGDVRRLLDGCHPTGG